MPLLMQEEVKILLRIGEGAFGEVSLATCAIFGSVAVKWLKVSVTHRRCTERAPTNVVTYARVQVLVCI